MGMNANKGELVTELSKTVAELERYENYRDTSVELEDESLVHLNRVRVQKLMSKTLTQCDELRTEVMRILIQ